MNSFCIGFQRAVLRLLASTGFVCLCMAPAQAQLFGGDDQARRAILDLRAKLEAQAQENTQNLQALQSKILEDATATKRQVLELSTQLDQLRREISTLRGDVERLHHELNQSIQKTDQRFKPLEPVLVNMDGLEFQALPEESRSYDAAMLALRNAQFSRAAELFAQMKQRYPGSGYTGHVLYWEGNAHYAARQYAAALPIFERLVSDFPQHPKTPDAFLSLANSHIELSNIESAKSVLEKLVTDHPRAEAAVTARERLSRLR